ncbi:hypothetical protein BGZ51_005542 [Haplosporangium sp. Z 767]|nr:hypothetical protein BGZ51_005542 [Haplosporangium sp. Z 767]KAF9192834.1 hypothetical protein BGZ50_008220 [Haplosporangium sp. Z 11]
MQDDKTVSMLQDVPQRLDSAKKDLDVKLEGTSTRAKTTLEKLQLLQSIVENSQKQEKNANPAQTAKAAFLKDITDAKEAFDQEMALRHADVVRQYVGSVVQQMDHY